MKPIDVLVAALRDKEDRVGENIPLHRLEKIIHEAGCSARRIDVRGHPGNDWTDGEPVITGRYHTVNYGWLMNFRPSNLNIGDTHDGLYVVISRFRRGDPHVPGAQQLLMVDPTADNLVAAARAVLKEKVRVTEEWLLSSDMPDDIRAEVLQRNKSRRKALTYLGV